MLKKKKKMLFSRIKDACTREMGLKRTMWDFFGPIFCCIIVLGVVILMILELQKDYLNLIAPELSELLVSVINC